MFFVQIYNVIIKDYAINNKEIELYNIVYRCTIFLTCKLNYILFIFNDCIIFKIIYRTLFAARNNDIIFLFLRVYKFIIILNYFTLF